MLINDKIKIVAILGKSGSGKSSITNELNKLGYKNVISHTDRPMRQEEVNSKTLDHIFTDTETIKKMIDTKEIIVITYYNNGFYYGASKEEIKNSHIYVIDEKGLNELIESLGKENVISIYIDASADIRFERIKVRSGIREALSRLEHDRNIFTKLKADYVVENNDDLDVAVNVVKNIIDEFYKNEDK